MRSRVLAALAVSLMMMGSSVDAQGRRRPRPPVPDPSARPPIELTLGDAVETNETAPRVPPAKGEPLSADDAKKVLDRLPPLEAKPGDEDTFKKREDSLPAPRPGKTVEAPFPPPDSAERAPETAPGALEVLRHQPDGPVPLAPRLSITFSRPMVPLGSIAELAREQIPVKLAPEPAGEWRWIGTKTLVFQPKQRFPMATKFTVEVPAGTKAQDGSVLEKSASFSFETPPPKVTAFHPSGGPQRLDPTMFLAFDQKIDPAAILSHVQVSSGNQRGVHTPPHELELASREDVDADPTIASLAKSAGDGRWIAFHAKAPFERAANVAITLAAGAPSAEGPLTTTAPQRGDFQTFGPLRVRDRWPRREQEASPFDGWSISFTNPIDAKLFKPDLVKVDPELPGKKVSTWGDTISIQGASKARTTYKVTISGALADVFGGTLGSDATEEFKVGPARKAFWGQDGLAVLDPSGPARFSVYSVNHAKLRVRAWKVGPEHWGAFVKAMSSWDREKDFDAPGEKVLDEKRATGAAADEIAETRVDLASLFEGGVGNAVVVIEPTERPKNRWEHRVIVAWVQSTKIGLDAFADADDLVAWATSLQDGKPLEGVELSVLPAGATATSAKDGTAVLAHKAHALPSSGVLVAKKDKDVAFLPENVWWGSGTNWQKRAILDQLRWFVFDDRHLYRPGEKVRVKGWLRRVGSKKDGDTGALEGAASEVSWSLHDSRGNEVLKGKRELDALGGFDLELELPKTMNLGTASLQLHANGKNVDNDDQWHPIEVQEFRRPEFEVSASASEGPHVQGGRAVASVKASYYAGGALPNAEVRWQVQTQTASFTPPNRGEFTFGTWIPWWMPWWGGGAETYHSFTGHTDASGVHRLGIELGAMRPRPVTITAEATVFDVNRQAWSSSTSLLVHPADHYVGLRTERSFVQKGDPIDVEAIVCDLDGKLVAGRDAELVLVRQEWTFEDGRWQQKDLDPEKQTVKSADGAVKARFAPKEGGAHKLTARVHDLKDRLNETELTIWVAGGKVPVSRDLEQERAQVIPDKKEYKAGDTAKVLVLPPFTPCEALVTVRRSGILAHQRISIDGPSHTLSIPIDETMVPNVHVQVDLVGASVRTKDSGEPDPKLPKRPAFAVGSVDLSVPPLARTLAVKAIPKLAALEPGATTSVDVSVNDGEGKPVANAQVCVVVVDESVLAMTGYRIPDPIATFYTRREPGVSDHHLRSHLKLARPEEVAAANAPPAPPPAPEPAKAADGAAPGGRARAAMKKGEAMDEERKSGGGASEQIKVRSVFDALALFAAAVPTDANGKATVEVKMPDSLTRYRVTAIAVEGGKRFGSGESTITARLPLMVRPSAPRFLNFGDAFELPVVLQNQTDAPLAVDVAARASNASLKTAGFRVTVPANDRVEVRFPSSAAKVGVARFQIGAASGKWADAANVELPVWTPATSEAFAVYGEVDDETPVAQAVRAPKDVFTEFGGLEITTSSTELQALTDAVIYLAHYPFECSEQLGSRVLSIAALKDVLAAFKAEGLPPPDELAASVQRDLERLAQRQNDDGSFGLWGRGEDQWPYPSVHAIHALARAKEKGFAVPDATLERSKQYLRTIESHFPPLYGKQARRTITAYALAVRARLGERDLAMARRVVKDGGLETLPLDAVGWILSAIAGDRAAAEDIAAIRTHLQNRAAEEAGTAHFVTDYGDQGYLVLHSDRRADGVVLEALIADQPKSDLIPKVVRGLLAHRKAGRWGNTQENAFILLALDRYFATYEKETPDFVARAWLGADHVAEHAFKGRTTDRRRTSVPMALLSEGGAEKDLVIAKTGPGRLYYRLGLRYAPSSLKLDPLDRGFAVTRVYEGIDDAKDVRRDADGTWRIKAGARVRVKLSMATPSRRYHVALVDPLPAGLEPLNPALATTGSIPQDPKAAPGPWWWWSRTWYEHQNLRDERAEAFASLLWEGVHEYDYAARATTPGTFVVPPPKAEEMYFPETFGRGATDRVIVEER